MFAQPQCVTNHARYTVCLYKYRISLSFSHSLTLFHHHHHHHASASTVTTTACWPMPTHVDASPPLHTSTDTHHKYFFYFFFFFFFASAAPIAATTTAACVDGSHHHHHSSVRVYHHTRVSFYFIFSSLHLFTSAGSMTITTIHLRQWPPTPPCPHAHATRQVSIILQCTAWY